MSCHSLAARAFTDTDKEGMTHTTALHRSVRFSSDSRASSKSTNEEGKKEAPGSISLTALCGPPPVSQGSAMSQSAPPSSATFDIAEQPAPLVPSCRFPKLEECAHFHYERVSLGGLSIETVACPEEEGRSEAETLSDGWICLKVRSHVNTSCDDSVETRTLSCSWTEASDVREWTLTRNRDNFLQLDDMLHRCIYDRKVSGLPNLSAEMRSSLDDAAYRQLISDYVHHLSIIADDSINCGPVLNWLQMDNKGHKLLVANEDSSSINTPAVAAAYSVRKYVSQARDEISFEVGDMISIIDMPGPQESLWWRGKRGFRVGFFPHHCVAVIGDKVPRHMTQPPPIVGSVAVAPIKPVLRKHGKLISLFRSFILSRPSRRSLKQQGILRERVFGCDLGEHLLNCGHDVPLVLVECARAIESRGAVDGVYRLSGGSGLTQRLRAAFDGGGAPDLAAAALARDPHAVPSLLKMYFRELPNPLCTYQLYESFVSAVQRSDDAAKLRAVRDAVVKLPPPHYRTLAYLMRHLRRVSLWGGVTGMTARNMAIVWAPNLLRSPRPQHALQGVAVQAVVTEFLICYAEELFSQEQDEDSGPDSLDQDRCEVQIELRGTESTRRPKSLPLNPPTKLLSLEEARRRGKSTGSGGGIPIPPREAPGDSPSDTLRPSGHLTPKYIEVGSGPNNLPQYHTVLDLPLPGKRGVKRSPSGWRGLFSRTKHQRPRARPHAEAALAAHATHAAHADGPHAAHEDAPQQETEEAIASTLRPVKSCESIVSDSDTLAPLGERHCGALKHHTRSSSCDSYFEPWQTELAEMRLRLSPQERDHHMFSEEDDTHQHHSHRNCVDRDEQVDSLCSSGGDSGPSSAEPSPRRHLPADTQHSQIVERESFGASLEERAWGYIDGESPRGKRHSPHQHHYAAADLAKRLCTDRDSPVALLSEFSSPNGSVKMRERGSPRKTKNSARYSGFHHPLNVDDKITSRLSWHGKDMHSTLIKIDWPIENTSVSNLTTSTINSSPLTPVTPVYDPLESDSEVSDNKQTIKVNNECDNCEAKCLKCELKATDYENLKEYTDKSSLIDVSPLRTDISYQNLNRLSAVSTSSNSETKSDRKDHNYENCDVAKVMTSSHDSSSTFSNLSPKHDEPYECYNYTRPNYINLQSSSSKSSPGSPLKSPLKSTISITFRSPTKIKMDDYEPIENNDTPTNDRDSVYEDIDLEKNLSIVEEAPVPETDASLPTQQACQPDFSRDLIILETPVEKEGVDVYSQVKFFKKSIEEVNAMILESPERERHYENVSFDRDHDYERIKVDVKVCDENAVVDNVEKVDRLDNGNTIKEKLNVRELANRFESPTELKPAFAFDKFKTEVKYPTLEKEEKCDTKPTSSPKTYSLTKNATTARSLDENAFVKEFGAEKDRRKSLEVKNGKKEKLDLNLNTELKCDDVTTPTSENKISLIQRFDKPEVRSILSLEMDKKLSRERIEKYKEERRNFLREKYSSQSFRSSPEQLTRLKVKKDDTERLKEELPKFERRNTVDLGQRMRFSLAKSSTNLDTIPSPEGPEKFLEDRNKDGAGRSHVERKEKMSPSYNIRDMTAMFEQKSHNAG